MSQYFSDRSAMELNVDKNCSKTYFLSNGASFTAFVYYLPTQKMFWICFTDVKSVIKNLHFINTPEYVTLKKKTQDFEFECFVPSENLEKGIKLDFIVTFELPKSPLECSYNVLFDQKLFAKLSINEFMVFYFCNEKQEKKYCVIRKAYRKQQKYYYHIYFDFNNDKYLEHFSKTIFQTKKGTVFKIFKMAAAAENRFEGEMKLLEEIIEKI